MGMLAQWYKALMQLISSGYIKNTIVKNIEKSPFRKKYSRKMTGGQYNKIAKDAVIKVIGPMKAGFIKSNFEAGGVPKFAGNTLSTIFTKSMRGGGYQPMVNTGLFKKSVIDNPKIQSIPGSLEPILLPRGVTPRILASMSILKNGGVINIPRTRKMRRFFFAMSKLSEGSEVGGIFKAAALSKERLCKN
jgi:hypothetical protein